MATKVITKKVRLSYAHLFKAVAPEGGGDPKFSVCLLIPKTDAVTIGAIKAAVEEAKQAGLPLWGGKLPANLKMPLRDGDAEKADRPEFKGMFFVNANSKNRPQVVEKNGENLVEITDPTAAYSGCYAKASINFYPFNTAGNRGIGCGLNNVMKLADGEPLGSRSTAEEDFGQADDDEDPLA
jgi:hypothetical protein